MKKNEKRVRGVFVLLGQLTALATIISLISSGDGERLLLAFATLLLVLVPEILERVFRCRIRTPLYIAGVLYALGPMMGHCWKFYYTIPFWDKLLHFFGGIVFAVIGFYLFMMISSNRSNHLAAALFAACFSISIAAVWEFIEYGADVFLGMDMQHDTVVPGITSFLLGTETGVTGSIKNINSVFVDSVPLPVNGYIDIGLHDTMLDMLLESLGALITAAILYADKGRHPLIRGR